MLIPTKATSSAIGLDDRQQAERTITAMGYIARWGEQITDGDLYTQRPFDRALICSHVSPFGGEITPSDVWVAPAKVQNCVKIVPRPKPNEQTINEKLDMLLQRVEAIETLLRRKP